MRLAVLLVVVTLVGCADEPQPAPPVVPARAPEPPPVVQPVAPAPPTPEAPPPVDLEAQPHFNAQVKAIFRVAACGGQDQLPARIPAKLVEAHCAALDRLIAEYRTRWLDLALPFLAGIVPAGLPDKVIYPFGGSDLVSALAVYPKASEITIISLEKVGDARRIDKIGAADLKASLAENRAHLQFLMRSAFHKTVDLKAMSESGLPGELVDALVALRVHGATPLALRYFTLRDDGTLEYTDKKFVHAELTFRRADGGTAVYRHIQADLSNAGLKKNVGLMAYLAARAPYASMTKASSFLMWESYFSTIRDTLLAQTVFLVSDATAPMPDVVARAGFEQVTYGKFAGPEKAFPNHMERAEPYIKLWKAQEHRPMPMRFGYSDVRGQGHLLITRKKAAP
jgi:hypothetical protein